MKKLLPILFIILFGLGCVEEIIGPERLVYDTLYLAGDTVYCPCIPIPPTLNTDTVDWGVTVINGDTLLYVVVDGDSVKGYINQRGDTIREYIHHFMDTLVTFEGGRPLEVLGEWQDIVEEFYRVSIAYGWSESLGGNLIIEPWVAEDFPPTNRSSFTYYIYDQRMIKLKESLTHDESMTPLFREFVREVFGKKYTTDPNSIMNPEFDPKRLKFNSSDAEKKPYFDVLFKH